VRPIEYCWAVWIVGRGTQEAWVALEISTQMFSTHNSLELWDRKMREVIANVSNFYWQHQIGS
jgi:hypothetical protein